MVSIDLSLQAGRTNWEKVTHDGWGRRALIDPVTGKSIKQPLQYTDARNAGAHVTTFGGDRWPPAANSAGTIYLSAYQFWKNRAAIERNGAWPGGFKACELVSIQYQSGYPSNNLRYLGFYGELIERLSATHALIRVFRAELSADGTPETAGEWAFQFGPGGEVDSTIGVQILNEDPRVNKALNPIERPLEVNDNKGTRGAVFINLSRAAELWDRSELQSGYGLASPKLPFWLD